jgi:hypothetical protein
LVGILFALFEGNGQRLVLVVVHVTFIRVKQPEVKVASGSEDMSRCEDCWVAGVLCGASALLLVLIAAFGLKRRCPRQP